MYNKEKNKLKRIFKNINFNDKSNSSSKIVRPLNKNSCELLLEMKKKLKNVSKSNEKLKSKLNFFKTINNKKNASTITKFNLEYYQQIQFLTNELFNDIWVILEKWGNKYNFLFNESFSNLDHDLKINFNPNELLIKSLNFTKSILKNELLNNFIKINPTKKVYNNNTFNLKFNKSSKNINNKKDTDNFSKNINENNLIKLRSSKNLINNINKNNTKKLKYLFKTNLDKKNLNV